MANKRTSSRGRATAARTSGTATAKKDTAKHLAAGFDSLSINAARSAASGHKEKANFFDNVAKQKEEAAKAKKR